MATPAYLKIAGILLLILLGIFQYRLWIKPGGIRDMHNLRKNLKIQIELNEQLKNENMALLFQIQKLNNNNKEAAESRARNELGMIKKGEVFYQIVK